MNFASENVKASKNFSKRVGAAEGVRDIFGRIIAVAAKSSNNLDLRHLLSFPITEVPLSLSHSDGIPLKTEQAALTKFLETKQNVVLSDISISPMKAAVIDGGMILYETVLQHSKSTYATMAEDLLKKVCTTKANEIHLVLDKYQSPSIKDCERKARYKGSQSFVITGPDQAQRQSGKDLLNNVYFKDEFAKFILEEWKKVHYGRIIGTKTLYISHGGQYRELRNDGGILQSREPHNLQGRHEEADTLIAFHIRSIGSGNVLVRSNDTDVVVMLSHLAGNLDETNIILDYGSGNHRRYIDISQLAITLEAKQAGLTKALLGLHALTGCDFTSCFFRKGKVKLFQRLVADPDHTRALISLSSDDVDVPGITTFVCSLYGFGTSDINEARYKSFMRTSKGGDAAPLAGLKKINCASLPPCSKSLDQHIKRAQFVAKMRKMADELSHCMVKMQQTVDGERSTIHTIQSGIQEVMCQTL